MKTRIETDSLGQVEIPQEKYWGAQTQRSLTNFKIGNTLMPKEIIQMLAIVKSCGLYQLCIRKFVGRETR